MTRPLKLLFVCSGNICRSPVAAALADVQSMELGIEVEVRSAGTLGLVDLPAAPHMHAVAREIGLDLTSHRSQALTPELVAWADRIPVMEIAHAEVVSALDPDATGKVIQLGPLVGKAQIDDPHRRWFKRPYRRARDEIAEAVRRMLRGESREWT